jgi:hypothetical protein
MVFMESKNLINFISLLYLLSHFKLFTVRKTLTEIVSTSSILMFAGYNRAAHLMLTGAAHR